MGQMTYMAQDAPSLEAAIMHAKDGDAIILPPGKEDQVPSNAM